MNTPTTTTAPPAPANPPLTSANGPGPERPAIVPATRPVRSWPVLLLALPAFVAIWSGWVGLGRLTGFGPVELLPGIWDGARINSAITLPIGMETYAAYALHVWLSHAVSRRAAAFAKWSAIGSLTLGAAGQVAYHLMSAAGLTSAPWLITALVACLPVAVLGMGAALAHLVHDTTPAPDDGAGPVDVVDQGDELDQAGDVPAVPAPTPRPKPTGTTPPRPGTGTAARAARLRAKHPDMTTAEIARRLGVSDRTVRRHLNPTTTASAHPITDTTTAAAA